MPVNVKNTKSADSLKHFRNAVCGSHGAYTAYKYVEGDNKWDVYSELVPGIVLTYTIVKDTPEEATFLRDKPKVDTYDPWVPSKKEEQLL